MGLICAVGLVGAGYLAAVAAGVIVLSAAPAANSARVEVATGRSNPAGAGLFKMAGAGRSRITAEAQTVPGGSRRLRIRPVVAGNFRRRVRQQG